MGKIGYNDILRQIKADLIGKDSYRGVTLTYSWMANQFGHFSLGFIPATIVFHFLQKSVAAEELGLRTAIYVSIFWIVFELNNFLGPLLLKKKSTSKLLYMKGPAYQFEPAWGNIAFDTFTDLCYFAIGAFTAATLLCVFQHITYTTVLTILIILIVVVIYPKHYWFITKMYEQAAQFPFQYRLSQFDLPISETAKQSIKYWLADNHKAKHLLIFGGVNCGKTSLSVGVANEKAIQHQAVIYTTATKLISLFFSPIAEIEKKKNAYPWNWRDCSYLVVDDINPGEPVKEDIITADYFLKLMDTYLNVNESNREVFKNTSVIWVLGKDDSAKNLQDNWKKMLHKIGVSQDHISSVEL